MDEKVMVSRKTRETDIEAVLGIYGDGKVSVDTGIGFFDHMLTAFAVHGGFDLELKAKGDLETGGHHTVEDAGIVLGRAFSQALGSKDGIVRFGNFYVPMDEALAFCAVDISGRPYLIFDAEFDDEMTGTFGNCLVEEFFRAFAFNAGITLHIRCLYGKNSHHKAEAIFKAAARALRAACAKNGGAQVSTKGLID